MWLPQNKPHLCSYNYTPRTTKLLGGILVSLRPSVCPSVRPSRMPCPLCNIYSSGWILSILGTNDHYHERVCRTQWPLTLTYIFKVIWPWLRKSCPLCSIYSSGWILFHILAQMIIIIRGYVGLYVFLRKFEFLTFFGLDFEIKEYTVLDGFFSYLAQMITSMRGCVTCNDLWPWPISSRSFGLGLDLMDSFHIWCKWSIAWEGVSHVMTLDLDLYLQGHKALT